MRKRSVGTIGLLLVFVLALASCSSDKGSPSTASATGSPDRTEATATYSASDPIDYSFEYPQLWKMEESGDPSAPVQFFGEGVTINLNIEEVGDATLDDYAAAAQQQLSALDGVAIESQTDSTMGGEPAVTIVSTQTKGKNSVRLAQTFAVVDGQAFVVTYGGTEDRFDADLGTAQALIDSFRF